MPGAKATDTGALKIQVSGKGSVVTGDLLVFMSMALFGSYPLFLRFCPNIPVLDFLLAFQIIGAAGFAMSHGIAGTRSFGRKVLGLLVALAAVASANDLAYFFALRLTSVANAAIAHQMVSGFLVLLAPPLLQEKITKPEWIALLLSFAGIAVLYSEKTHGLAAGDFAGISLALGSAMSYAVLIILYRQLSRLGISIVTINFWRYVLSTFLVLPAVLMAGRWLPQPSDLLVLAGFGLLYALIGSTLYAVLFLGEMPTLAEVLGGALIIGSSLWLATIKHEHE